MHPSSSSPSYWPQTKVTLLVRSISLVLVLASILGLHTEAVAVVVSSPVQVQRGSQERHYCDFTTSGRLYSISDLLECMNELATISALKRRTRSTGRNFNFFPSTQEINQREYPHYSPSYSDSQQYFNQPDNTHRGPAYPVGHQPGHHYARPPALPPGYLSGSSSTPGILGINLLDALSSISQYDDRKCVPRIICEVATGVIPGNSGYKQSYASSGMNALIGLLTAVDIGGSSPLLNFGKSALTGYTNKGNPEVCHQQYPQCPRNPSAVVDYLNNHNGGFFRFFSNRNSGVRYRDAGRPESAPLADTLVSDRKGTGELKFDTTTASPRSQSLGDLENKNTYSEDFKLQDTKQIVFPDDQRLLNRFTKSLDYRDYESSDDLPKKSSVFPQDRKDHKEVGGPFYYSRQGQSSNNEPQDLFESSNAKLYLTGNFPSQKLKSFTFPDGQRVMIDIGFTKLFSEGYKKTLKRGLMNDEPQPIDLEGLNVINLAELYDAEEETQLEQVIHPCDMICHDSKGTAVQFSQVVSSGSSGSRRRGLSTLMTPDRPILDLSEPLPCEVMCLDSQGDRRHVSTTLDRVLRAQHRPYEEERPSVRNKIVKPRFVGDAGPVTHQQPMVPFTGMPLVNLAGGPGLLPGAGYLGQAPPPMLHAQQQIGQGATEEVTFIEADSVPIGENPLAIAVEPLEKSSPEIQPDVELKDPSVINGMNPLPAALTMCGGCLYIVPVNSIAMPVCATSLQPAVDKPSPIIFESTNPWSNYSHFFAEIANSSDESFSDVFDDLVQPTLPNYNRLVNEHLEPMTTTISNNFYEISTVTTTEAVDYPQLSCLEGESWNLDNHQCVPVKYNQDAEYDESPPISNWENVHIRKREPGQKQKIIIITPHADMYIQANNAN